MMSISNSDLGQNEFWVRKPKRKMMALEIAAVTSLDVLRGQLAP